MYRDHSLIAVGGGKESCPVGPLLEGQNSSRLFNEGHFPDGLIDEPQATARFELPPDMNTWIDSFSVRAEHFDDPDGYVLFPSSTARGAFNALTTRVLSARAMLGTAC